VQNVTLMPAAMVQVASPVADFDTFARNALRDANIATTPRPASEHDVPRIRIAAY
jgi:alcohol dehydrogenase class IV